MKKFLMISPAVVLSALLALAGLALICQGAYYTIKVDNCEDLYYDSDVQIAIGDYVDFWFDECMISDHFLGKIYENRTEQIMGKNYKTFVARSGKDKYLRVRVYNTDSIAQINAFGEEGEHKKVRVKGRVVADDGDYADWETGIKEYQRMLINRELCIVEINDKFPQNFLLLGAFILGIAAIINHFSEGIQNWDKNRIIDTSYLNVQEEKEYKELNPDDNKIG